MSGTSRFDCYPSDFLNGVIGMTADQIAVYTVVLMLQYDRGEAIKVEGNERELAVRAGLSRGRLTKAIEDLVKRGKLLSADGGVLSGKNIRWLQKTTRPSDWQKMRLKIFERDGFACTYCGDDTSPLDCDHIVPLSRGGTNYKENLTTSCFRCNRSKGAKLVGSWYAGWQQ